MTALFMVTRDPFLPWKHTERVLREAERRGFETFVALDNRSSDEDFEHIRALANKVAPFKSEGSCESAFRLVQAIEEDFFFRVDDDEIPTAACWDFAANPPAQARWGIPVIPIVRPGSAYTVDVGAHERLSYRPGWEWHGGLNGYSTGARQAILTTDWRVLIWHMHLDSPRAVREEKVRRYSRLDGVSSIEELEDHRRRSLFEDYPVYVEALPAHLLKLWEET